MTDPTPPIVPPELDPVWHTGPHMTGDVRGGSGSGTSSFGGVVHPYEVSPGSLLAAGNVILGHVDSALSAYETVRTQLGASESWMFSVRSPDVLTDQQYRYNGTGASRNGTAPARTPLPIGYQEHADWTDQWTTGLHQVLLMVADRITMASEFVDAVNNAGQMYTKADMESPMPQIREGH